MTDAPDLEPTALEAAKKAYNETLTNDELGDHEYVVRAYLAARSTAPEAGKAVDDARQLPAVEVMSADTLPSGDEYLISKAFVHEGAIIALYGTNDKLIGWIDTNAWMRGRVYRDQILPLASSPAPTGAEDDSDLPTAEDVRGILGPAPQAVPAEEIAGDELGKITAALAKANIALAPVADGGGAWHYEVSMPLANPPQPVVLAEDIAGLVNAIISRLIYPVSAEINPRGWEFRENSMLEEAVRFIKNEVAAELTASEAEATDLRHKLGELLAVIHRDGGHYQDFAGTEQTVADAHSAVTLLFQAQDERNDLRRNLEEARKALEHAAVAAYDEPAYLSPDGMERGADGLLPPGSPYDRGRYDARKAVENIARALKGSAQ